MIGCLSRGCVPRTRDTVLTFVKTTVGNKVATCTDNMPGFSFTAGPVDVSSITPVKDDTGGKQLVKIPNDVTRELLFMLVQEIRGNEHVNCKVKPPSVELIHGPLEFEDDVAVNVGSEVVEYKDAITKYDEFSAQVWCVFGGITTGQNEYRGQKYRAINFESVHLKFENLKVQSLI